jgi:hypothetical protein
VARHLPTPLPRGAIFDPEIHRVRAAARTAAGALAGREADDRGRGGRLSVGGIRPVLWRYETDRVLQELIERARRVDAGVAALCFKARPWGGWLPRPPTPWMRGGQRSAFPCMAMWRWRPRCSRRMRSLRRWESASRTANPRRFADLSPTRRGLKYATGRIGLATDRGGDRRTSRTDA